MANLRLIILPFVLLLLLVNPVSADISDTLVLTDDDQILTETYQVDTETTKVIISWQLSMELGEYLDIQICWESETDTKDCRYAGYSESGSIVRTVSGEEITITISDMTDSSSNTEFSIIFEINLYSYNSMVLFSLPALPALITVLHGINAKIRR